jgi:putative transposase
MDWRVRSSRRRAVSEAGHAHELTFSCYRGFQFLRADQTCQWLADEIDAARHELDFALWAYVFMPEHVHLLIHPRRPVYDVSAILQRIKEPVGRKAVAQLRLDAPEWLPRITVKRGKRLERRFWQAGGGYDRNVWEPHVVLAMIEYIHNNPVRRGLVSRAEDWKWSSAGWHEGKNSLRPDPIDLGGFCVFTDGRG